MMKMSIRKLFKPLAVVVCVVLGAVVAVWILSRDVAPPDISRFVVERPDVPDDENAYTYFSKAVALHGGSIDVFENVEKQIDILEPAIAADVLFAANKETFDLIQQALACKRNVPPLFDFENEGDSQNVTVWWRGIVPLVILKAQNEYLAGNMEGCVELLEILQQSSASFLQYPNSLVGLLFWAGAPIVFTQETLAYLASDMNVPRDLIERLKNNIPRNEDVEQAGKMSTQLEVGISIFKPDSILQNLILDSGDIHVNPNGGFGYMYQPNRTKHLIARIWDEGFSQWDGWMWQKEDILFKKYPWYFRFRPNNLGIRLANQAESTIKIAHAWIARLQEGLDFTRTALALNLYHQDYGEYPETLEALVPDYLPEVPKDPYDGNPFRYSKERRILYSVGNNQMDDSGDAKRDKPFMPLSSVGYYNSGLDAVLQFAPPPSPEP